MGQTLIIRGADFSDIAIGTVEVPIDLADETLAWITASGNNSFTDAQKIAIDDFITAIGFGEEGSIYSKIDRLWLPMLAGDKAHSLVDYRHKTIYEMAQEESNTFDTYVSFENKGLHGLTNTNVYAPIIDPTFVGDRQNISVFLFNSVQYTSSISGGIGSKTRGPLALSDFFYINTGSSSSTIYINDANTPKLRFETSSRKNPQLIGFISTQNALRVLYRNSSIGNAESTLSSGVVEGVSILNNHRYLNADSISMGGFVIAKALSDTEAKTLRTAFNNLFTALSA